MQMDEHGHLSLKMSLFLINFYPICELHIRRMYFCSKFLVKPQRAKEEWQIGYDKLYA